MAPSFSGGAIRTYKESEMTLERLMETLPSYAKDMKLNFSSVVANQTDLNEQQLWGTVVGCAMVSRNEDLTAAALEEASSHMTPQALEAAKSAAAVMGMNNIYYRFLHLASNEKYGTMRAGLRMNVIRTHGIDPLDFELWCLAVSAINGCGACVDSHEKVLREKGFGEEKVLAAVRVASVLHAVATVLDTERVAAGEPVSA
jgi:alkyl hydroperoxide reductase subunit D